MSIKGIHQDKTSCGLTLMEIIVATILFALILMGLANLFMAAKRFTLHSRSRMTAGELSKVFLNPLQMQVRQDTWSNATLNCLSTGSCPNQTQVFDRTYTANYTINNNAPVTNINRVRVNIQWNETSP